MMKKDNLKVLMVCPYAEDGGGISRWTKNILDYYHSLGEQSRIDIELINTSRSVSMTNNGSTIREILCSLKDYRKIIRTLLKTFRKNHFDVIHITSTAGFGLLRDFFLLFISKHRGVKTYLHFHFGRIPKMDIEFPKMWFFLKIVLKKVHHIIVLDENSKQRLLHEGINNVSVLPNPLSYETVSIIRGKNSIPRVPRSVLFVGHCVKEKGVFELIDACKTIDNIDLILIGEISKDVESVLSSASGIGWIHAKGVLPYDQVIDEMLKCDVFVLPSYSEGFPNVIIEAMACGCAIVATSVGAIPQMLEYNNSSCGLLVPPKDVLSLSSAICGLIDNEGLKGEIQSNASNKVRNEYDISSIWKKLVLMWTEL